jgi:hypothetical protein
LLEGADRNLRGSVFDPDRFDIELDGLLISSLDTWYLGQRSDTPERLKGREHGRKGGDESLPYRRGGRAARLPVVSRLQQAEQL